MLHANEIESMIEKRLVQMIIEQTELILCDDYRNTYEWFWTWEMPTTKSNFIK